MFLQFSPVIAATIAFSVIYIVAARPTDDHIERQFVMEIPVETQIITLKPEKDAKPTDEPKRDATRDIIEKIKQINQHLQKPHKQQYHKYQKYQVPIDTQIANLTPDQEQQTYVPKKDDTRDIIEKIKQINENLEKPKQKHDHKHKPYFYPEDSYQRLDTDLSSYGRLLRSLLKGNTINGKPSPRKSRLYAQNYLHSLLENPTAIDNDEPIAYSLPSLQSLDENLPLPALPKYIIVPVSPNTRNIPLDPFVIRNSNSPNLKQLPSLPISIPSIPWPLAQYFPIIIKDPLLALIHGGGLNNIVEYGQAADVCSRGQLKYNNIENLENKDDTIEFNKIVPSRLSRALRSKSFEKSEESNFSKKSKKSTKLAIKKPSKLSTNEQIEASESIYKNSNDGDDGDLRFTDFGLFGNKKPVAPSPGFFINRLKVRRGGVAIAGPGGVATAGRGGTAIVGPGGLAYTQPGGLAIAGPAARVVALSSEADLNELISQIQKQPDIQNPGDESVPRRLKVVPGGKVVATGPVVYYHKTDET